MAAITSIREGLATRLKTIAGLNVYDHLPGQFSTPAAITGGPSTVDYDAAMRRGLDRYEFPVRLYASMAHSRGGQDALDEYLASSGAKSVKAAIEGDRTLGGAVSDLRVTTVSGYGRTTYGGVDYFGAEILVELYATGV